MSSGILVTILSSLFLSLTIMADKLMVADFYENNPKIAWIVSSVAGSFFGIIGTVIFWFYIGASSISENLIKTVVEFPHLLFYTIIAGLLTTLTLRCYFRLMGSDVVATSVSIVIAATPVFIFFSEVALYQSKFNFIHYVSFTLTISGLLLYEYISSPKTNKGNLIPFVGYIVGVVLLGSGYVLLINEIFYTSEIILKIDTWIIAAVLLPFYWIGFGIGNLYLFNKRTLKAIKKLLKRWLFIFLIILLEILGAAFYFFEFLGLAKVSATLVALIVGSHIIFVWFFDLYMSYKYKRATFRNFNKVKILFFEIPVSYLYSYAIPKSSILVQLISILLVLGGLSIWPK